MHQFIKIKPMADHFFLEVAFFLGAFLAALAIFLGVFLAAGFLAAAVRALGILISFFVFPSRLFFPISSIVMLLLSATDYAS